MNRGMKPGVSQAVPDAFPERRTLIPIWGGLPVPSVRWQQLWPEQAETVLREDASAYPHIPFCANHCVFCGFCRNAWKGGYSQICTGKIIAKPEQEAEIRQGSGKIRAVYFGGGTPTALPTGDLVRLIRACYRHLPTFGTEARRQLHPAQPSMKSRATIWTGKDLPPL